MGRAFIQRLLNALYKERTIFNTKKENKAISEAKDQAATRDKARNKTAKTANTRSKANLKEKHKPETEAEAEAEERIRSCAVEIKGCIDLINNSSTGTPGKPKGGRGRANVDNRKADKSAGNRKTSGSRNSDRSAKRSKQGVSPAEMVILLAKAEEKLSEAVVKAKEKDDKKKKETRKK
jgi:hypothetical protein